MEIGLSRLHFPVTTLGPGQRLGIWLQGCHLRCEGCISTDTWPKAKKMLDIDDLLSGIDDWLKMAQGITISGGEPFEQPHALTYLVSRLKQLTEVDILVYTGFPLETIADLVSATAPYIDVIISDPFEYKRPNTLSLRGSDNQRMHLLTELGAKRFVQHQYRSVEAQDKVLDMMFDNDGTLWLAGIPQRDDFLTLQTLLEAEGHQLKTTAHKTQAHRDTRKQAPTHNNNKIE